MTYTYSLKIKMRKLQKICVVHVFTKVIVYWLIKKTTGVEIGLEIIPGKENKV